MAEFMDELHEQFKLIRTLSNSAPWNTHGVNSLLRALVTFDKLMADYYDPPYRQIRSEVSIRYGQIYANTPDEEFISAGYSIALYWIKGLSALLGRKGFISGEKTAVVDDNVGANPAFENPNFAQDDDSPDQDQNVGE